MKDDDLTLEKLEIVKRLSTLESKFDVLITKMDSHSESDNRLFKAISENLEKLNTLIIGDGGKIGIAEKVRGIEGISNHVKGIWGVCTAGLVEFIYRTFFHHPKG